MFPYLDTKNYRKFLRTPGAHNPSTMTKEQTLVHLAASGYEPICQRDLTHIAYLGCRLCKRPDALLVEKRGSNWLAVFKQ